MKVLVTGSRYWKDVSLIFEALDDIHWVNSIDTIIEGCARGADSIAERWAIERGIINIHFPADWDKYGKAAGPIRNNQMLIEGNPDLVIAFHDDLANSAGTGDMVKKAEKAGLDVIKIKH